MKAVVLSASTKISKSNRPFGTYNLIDDKGESHTLYVWGDDNPYESFTGINISDNDIKDNDGFKSTAKKNISTFKVTKDSALYKHIPTIPTTEEIHSIVKDLADGMMETQKDFFTRKSLFLLNAYRDHAAAKNNHHAYKGGLLTHTYEMLTILKGLRDVYPFKFDIFQVAIGIVYHDYGKMFEYSKGDVTEAMFLAGHIYIGANALQKDLIDAKFDAKYMQLCIHTVLAHHGRIEHGSPVKPATIEAFLVHHIDMLSGHGDIYDKTGHLERKIDTTFIKES